MLSFRAPTKRGQVQLSVGDTAPPILLPTHTGQTHGTKDALGRPFVLFVYLRDGAVTCMAEACGFRDAYQEFKQLGVAIFGLSPGSAESHKTFAEKNQLPFPLLLDEQGRIALVLGAARPESSVTPDSKMEIALIRTTFLIDANQRIAKIYTGFDPATHAFQVLQDVRELFFREPPRLIVAQAPVLLIPNALPLDFCAHLMDVWETEGNVDSGFMKQVGDKTVGMYDYGHKIRRDHFLKDGPTLSQLRRAIAHRVIPEIQKAFNYEVTRFEDFRVACYDSTRGGYFRPHRDNTTEGTAHRRFAMSLLLNEEYEGGNLRFAEYAPHLYRPAAGSAVIFSCSLLHEATDVTAGRRFVLLSFFYGDREAKLREDYNMRSGGEYRASGPPPPATQQSGGNNVAAQSG